MPFETERILTLSDTWLTTQASSLLLGFTFTDTGSIPTGISASSAGAEGLVRSKTETRESGVFKANSRVPSPDMRIGLVCAPSKLTNSPGGTCARESAGTMSSTNAATIPANSIFIDCPSLDDLQSQIGAWSYSSIHRKRNSVYR